MFYVDFAYLYIGRFKLITLSILFQGQSESDIKGHNLVYLHVNYNTFRLAFWLLSYLMEDPKALAALKDEIHEKIQSTKDETTGTSNLTIGDVEKMKILGKYCNTPHTSAKITGLTELKKLSLSSASF